MIRKEENNNMKLPELSIILPCYNESGNIPIILERLSKFWPDINFELIMVNNGSTDDSALVLEEMKRKYTGFLRIVTIEKNIGYGHGILTGLKAASAEILAYSHADIQTPPEDIIKAYHLLKEKNYNIQKTLIKGMRVNRHKEEVFLTSSLAQVVEMILGYPMEDINGQPKLFSQNLLKNLIAPPTDFSFDVYIMYLAKITGLQLITFPVDFGVRIHGKSKWASNILSKYKTILKYLISILKIAKAHYNAHGNLLRQLVRFLTTGILTNLINYATFFILLHLVGVYYVISSIVGFIAGLITGFLVNRSWTFSATTSCPERQLIKFFIINMISLGANLLTITFFTEVLGIIPEISQIIAIGVSTIINFTGSKFWAFRT